MIIEKQGIHKILVVKLRAIGDVVLSTVVLPNLRANFPSAQIDFLCEMPSADVVAGNPSLNNCIFFNPKEEHGLHLIRTVRRGRYDTVIDLFGNPRSAIVTMLSGARYRVGYRFGWRRYCYNIVITPRGGAVHNTEFNLDALRAIGVSVKESRPYFPLSPEGAEFAAHFMESNGLNEAFCVAMNAGGGWYTKRWRPDKYAELGSRLREKFNAKILLVWGPGERQIAEEINAGMMNMGIILPQSTLAQLGAILRRCNVFITNDSGPMHIGAAMGVPIIAFFGPTNPSLQGPVGSEAIIIRNEKLDCLCCNLTECPIGNPCMLDLSVDEVYGRIRGFIERIQSEVYHRHAQKT